MPETVDAHRSEVLSELDIPFYDDDDVTFHFNSGRDWESETVVEEQEDGTTIEKQTVCSLPCPHVSVYDQPDGLHALVHLPHLPDPIVIAHLAAEDGESVDTFLTQLVASLEESYEGIDEITEFSAEDADLGHAVRDALTQGTPDSVAVPAFAE